MLAPLEKIISLNWITLILSFVIGVIMLWKSSDILIKKVTPIAKFFGVKELVITILGISILSSLPEFTVSFFANMHGKSDISIGNVVGSNFVTLTFVTALCALISPLAIRKEVKDREASWMTLSTAIILILALDGTLSRIDGLILILSYFPYIFTVVKEAVKESKESALHEEGLKPEEKKMSKMFFHFLIALIAIAGIIYGADITLKAGENIGMKLGISQLVLGILIFAFGTSLPELSISLSATLKRKADITIGEIYASNIFTALFVLGACCLINPMIVSDNVKYFSLPFLILTGIIIQIFITTGSKMVRLEALVILGLYIYFVLNTFFNIPLRF
jgi:cation:H+ antiporter